MMDHLFQLEGPAAADEPMLEGHATLACLAARTSRMTLGLLVIAVMYRHPGVRAKTVTTVDVLRAHRAAEGRDDGRIEKTLRPVHPVLGNADAFLADVSACAQVLPRLVEVA